MLRLAVSDLGPGIPEADRERVFDMFYRVNAGDRHNSGTGPGLAITRGIVQAHGGDGQGAAATRSRQGTRIEIDLRLAACALALTDGALSSGGAT